MIRINLLEVKKRRRTDPVLIELLVFIAVVLGGVIFIVNINFSMRSELNNYNSEIALLQLELNKLKKFNMR